MVERKIVNWSELAERQYKKSLEYHFASNGNVDFCIKLNNDVQYSLLLIGQFNELGVAIPKTNFRFVKVLSYSIVYEIDNDFIYILLFWNNRRNPKTLKILLQELS